MLSERAGKCNSEVQGSAGGLSAGEGGGVAADFEAVAAGGAADGDGGAEGGGEQGGGEHFVLGAGGERFSAA